MEFSFFTKLGSCGLSPAPGEITRSPAALPITNAVLEKIGLARFLLFLLFRIRTMLRRGTRVTSFVRCASANYEKCSEVQQSTAQHTKRLWDFRLNALWCVLPDLAALWHHLRGFGTIGCARHADITHGFLLSATHTKTTIAH